MTPPFSDAGTGAPGSATAPASSRTAPLAPHPHLRDYYARPEVRQAYVNSLFDEAAPHYEWILSVMAPFGEGDRYRRDALRRAGLAAGMRALDVATGTGPVARAARQLVGEGGSVVGLDPSLGMLRQAARAATPRPANDASRSPGLPLLQGFGEALPFADGSFDFLSIGFAMRHLPDLRRTFGEFRRVLRPGGVAVVLEIAPPRSRVGRGLLRLYLGKLVPALTRWGTRSAKATELMRYYWDTVEQCVPPEAVLGALRDAGFTRVERHVELAVFNEYRAIV